MSNPACPLCEQNQYAIKSGFNRTRTQRYRCQPCQGYFTPKPKPMGHDPETRNQAVKLYLEGTSYRAVGRLLGVHNQSVINWVGAEQAKLPQQVSDQSPTDYIEVDELFSFVQAKKQVYVVMGVCGDTGLITGCGVMEERTQSKMQEFVEQLPPAIFYCSDGFSVNQELVWPLESEHLVSKAKERTHTIESINAQLRTYLARLKRKSRCFSRSLTALWQSVRLFVWHYNRPST